MVEGVKRRVGRGMVEVGDKIGPYRIVDRIGAGGFAEVYEATSDKLGKRVAIKLLSVQSREDPDNVRRFIREGRALGKLDKHPGVVSVIALDECPKHGPYLVMEFVEGMTLRDWLNERPGPVRVLDALFIVQRIAEVMKDVHGEDVVHRDLKPENVMLVAADEGHLRLRPKIIDFGIAKVAAPTSADSRAMTNVRTAGTSILGTNQYMSPEQFTDADKLTPQVDVYALGIMLYEMLVGRLPFESSSTVKLLHMHLYKKPKRLDKLVPTIPLGLANFIAAMLKKNPLRRPSMAECAKVLGQSWNEERRVPSEIRGAALPRYGARNRHAILIVVLVVVAAVVAIAWNARRQRIVEMQLPAPMLPSAEIAPTVVPSALPTANQPSWRDQFKDRAWDLRTDLARNKEIPVLLTTSLREVRQSEQVRPGERVLDLIAVLIEWSEYERTHGQVSVAQSYADDALALIGRALQHDPNNRLLRLDQAMTFSKRGKVWLAKREAGKAWRDFQNSIAAFAPGGKSTKDDLMILATSHLELGQAELLREQRVAANGEFSTAFGARRNTAFETDDPYWRLMFAETSYFKAKSTTDEAKAKEDLDHAWADAQEGEKSWRQKAMFARIHCEYGNIFMRKHDMSQARLRYKNAYDLAKPLFDKAPTHKDNALILIEALRGLKQAGGALEDDPCKIAKQFFHDDPEDKRFDLQDCKP